MKYITLFILGLSLFFSSCEDDDAIVVTDQPQTLCDSIDVLYTNDVAPILEAAGCSGSYCHGGGAAGIFLDNYANTVQAVESTKFLKAIRHEVGASPMPKSGPQLSDEDIAKIECWIQSGTRE